MRILMAAGGGILIGVGLAWGEAIRRAEKSAKEHYELQLDAHIRALKSLKFNQTVVDGPHESEDDLVDADEEIRVGGDMVIETPMATPDYIAAATQYGNPGSTLDEYLLSLSYIEEEEYEEDDGRAKEQITILMGGGDDIPLFFMDGMQIDDWPERVGDSILVDFYKLTPPGKERVLYVRNNKRDEDYEVIQEFP